jgi:hypothetical protein
MQKIEFKAKLTIAVELIQDTQKLFHANLPVGRQGHQVSKVFCFCLDCKSLSKKFICLC